MEIIVRIADISDLPKIMALIDRSYRDGRTGFLAKHTAETIVRYITTSGVVHVAEYDSLIVGYSILELEYDNNADNRMERMGIEPELWNSGAGIKGCLVDPEYRGNGLQRKFLELREEYAVTLGLKFLHARCNANNKRSLKNLEQLGLHIVTGAIFEDQPCLFLMKELEQNKDVILPPEEDLVG